MDRAGTTAIHPGFCGSLTIARGTVMTGASSCVNGMSAERIGGTKSCQDAVS